MKTTYQELIDIIRLRNTENVGDIAFIKLINQYGNATNALNNLYKFTKHRNKTLKVASKSFAEQEIELSHKQNVHIITYLDDEYPFLLKKIDNFPPYLYVKGHLRLLQKVCVAIVGSRNASFIGKQNAFEFAEKLTNNGILVVSGLAKGIDSKAHEGALMKGTIAVLGNGIDVVYPKENSKLYDQIAEYGALVSEYRLNSKPLAYNFPHRNRIITGMSRGVLIVEAALNSGTMITANLSLEQNRDVWAIPGNPKDPKSSGTNQLIKNGAQLVETVDDILQCIKTQHTIADNQQDKLNYTSKKTEDIDEILNSKEFHQLRDQILNALSTTPINIDIIIRELNCSYEWISIILLELELNGQIIRHFGNKVSLNSNDKNNNLNK